MDTRAKKALTVAIVLCLASGMLLFSRSAGGTQSTYAMTLTTDSSSYFPGQAIHVSGTITPAPGPNTGAFVRVASSGGTVVLLGEADVGATSGKFTFNATAGGTPSWQSGTFTVNATWGAYGPLISCTRTFGYGTSVTPVTHCTSAGSTTTTTSTTSSTSSSTTSTSSTTTSSTSTTAVPEFQDTTLPVILLAVLVVSALILARSKANELR